MKTLNGNMDKLAEDIQNSGIPAELSDRLVWRVRASSDRATARAQEKMRWAQEKIERKLATAQQKADMGAREAQESGGERRHRSWRMNWTPAYKPGRPTPENPTHESVIHDERLAVLRMLEQKKITSEEAEKLLSALEGSNG